MVGRDLLYWDACVFIAHLQNEKRAAEEMAGIEEMVALVDKGKAILLTSVLTRIEVLECKMTDAQKGMFENLLKKRVIQSIAVDSRIAQKAHDIRNHYALQDKVMWTPDAIHLATAILYKADVFYTFDGAGKSKAKKSMGLISISGDVAGHNLKVAVPMGQPSLFTGLPKPAAPKRSGPQPPPAPGANLPPSA